MTVAGWHPDPSGLPGRLRWWDGQAWTNDVHDPGLAPVASGSPLDAAAIVVGPPRAVTPGCRLFELSDRSGGRLGRLVETSRGMNDSAFGAALSRSRGWQHATTRELRGANGYPELVLAWGPAASGAIAVTLPDGREVGRLVAGEAGWSLMGIDGRPWGMASSAGVIGPDGGFVCEVRPSGGGGWEAAVTGTPRTQPLRSLVAAAALLADVL